VVSLNVLIATWPIARYPAFSLPHRAAP